MAGRNPDIFRDSFLQEAEVASGIQLQSEAEAGEDLPGVAADEGGLHLKAAGEDSPDGRGHGGDGEDETVDLQLVVGEGTGALVHEGGALFGREQQVEERAGLAVVTRAQVRQARHLQRTRGSV